MHFEKDACMEKMHQTTMKVQNCYFHHNILSLSLSEENLAAGQENLVDVATDGLQRVQIYKR